MVQEQYFKYRILFSFIIIFQFSFSQKIDLNYFESKYLEYDKENISNESKIQILEDILLEKSKINPTETIDLYVRSELFLIIILNDLELKNQSLSKIYSLVRFIENNRLLPRYNTILANVLGIKASILQYQGKERHLISETIDNAIELSLIEKDSLTLCGLNFQKVIYRLDSNNNNFKAGEKYFKCIKNKKLKGKQYFSLLGYDSASVSDLYYSYSVALDVLRGDSSLYFYNIAKRYKSNSSSIHDFQLASIYLSKGNFDSALYIYEKVLQNENTSKYIRDESEKGLYYCYHYLKIHDKEIDFANKVIVKDYENSINERNSLNSILDIYYRTEAVQIEKINLIEKNKLVSKSNTYLSISIILAMILFLFIIYYLTKYFSQKFKETEIEINEISSSLEKKRREIISKSLKIIDHVKYINEIKKEIKALKVIHEDSIYLKRIKSIEKSLLNIEKNIENWEAFSIQFEEIYPDFYKKLYSRNLNLTKNDIMLSTYLKLRIDNTNISIIQNVTQESVSKSKSRLKKKLNLKEEDNLDNFILGL